MATLSPARRTLNRYRRNQAGSFAVAHAATQAALVATGSDHRRLATLARRMNACATSASFKLVTPPGEATFVQVRNQRGCRTTLCMQCARYRARNAVRTVVAQTEVIRELYPDAPFAFLTLSSVNQAIGNVQSMLDLHEAGLKRFHRLRPVMAALLGHVTSIEIAIRGTVAAPEAGVHSHSLLVNHPDYYRRDRDLYLSQADIVAHWRAALRCSYDPICHIKRVRGLEGRLDAGALHGAILESIKYAIAPHELFQRSPFGVSALPHVVGPLVLALYKRRLVRSAGVFTAAAKILKQRAKLEGASDEQAA